MILMAYVAVGIVASVASLYFAWRSRDFRKLLAGAFFVSSGILFYLYLADVSVPILGTNAVETPERQRLPLRRPLHPVSVVSLFRVHQGAGYRGGLVHRAVVEQQIPASVATE